VDRKIGRFLIVGVINTTFSYIVFLLVFSTTSSVAFSLVCSAIIGILISYKSNLNWVWKSSRKNSFTKYLFFQSNIIAMNWLILHWISILEFSRILFQAFLLPIFAVVQYLLNKRYVF